MKEIVVRYEKVYLSKQTTEYVFHLVTYNHTMINSDIEKIVVDYVNNFDPNRCLKNELAELWKQGRKLLSVEINPVENKKEDNDDEPILIYASEQADKSWNIEFNSTVYTIETM